MTADTASRNPAMCRLQPIDLNDKEQYQRLQSQRRECGWYYEDEYLNRWQKAAVTGAKCLFWITTPSFDAGQSIIFAGHISLDSFAESEKYQHELARPDKSLLTISTFFVLPEYRGAGIGGQAMAQVEQLAGSEPYGHPRCSAVTIMSLSCQYTEDPMWRARYIEWTGETPSSYERWYSRIGCVKWKEEACTEIIGPDNRVILLIEVFLKKTFSTSTK